MTTARSSLPCILLAMASLAVAAGPSAEGRFLAGLRERGLFELAETYCDGQLRRQDLSAVRRAELTIELSRSSSERAVSSPGELRGPLWRRASSAIDDFVAKNPRHPHLLPVRFQGALVPLTRGELARQESQVVAGGATRLEQARSQLRTAVAQLRLLAEDVESRLRERNLSGRAEADELDPYQLASLQKNVQYQLARTYRNQAQCYGPSSADRTNSLTRAVKLLEVLARLTLSDPVAWQARIELIVSHRLLADFDTARLQLASLLKEQPPPSVKLRARAERIRLALATGELPEALALFDQDRQVDGVFSAELDYARLEVCLAAWRRAVETKQGDNATFWQNKAGSVVAEIQRQYTPYWTRRAEMLLAGYVRAAPQSGNLAMLVRAAESSFRSGQLDHALEGYDRARTMAAKQGHTARAFELGYIAAAIEHKRRRHQQAMQRYVQLAAAMPKEPGAPEAHLLAIHHAAQIAKAGNGDGLDQYVSLLRQHLEAWPAGTTADQVRLRLGRLLEHKRELPGAVRAYRDVTPGTPQHLQAVEAAGRCYRTWLDGLKSAGEPTAPLAGQAADWFESLLFDSRGNPPELWSPVQRCAALAAVRLRLNYTPDGYQRAQSVLSMALAGAADAPGAWKSEAEALLVLSLAAAGRTAEAGKVLDRLSAGPPEALLDMLEGLSRKASAARPQVRVQLAKLQLRTVEMLERRGEQLGRGAQQTLRRIRARALADGGRAGEALSAYRALAAQYPRDGQIQEAYAELLSARNDRESVEAALAKWRELQKKSPQGSQRWFRARYAVAELHHRLGNEQQAAKMITLLKVLHPELGGDAMSAKFEELLRRCQ